MNDTFASMIERYLIPMEKLTRVTDSSYFLRKNMSFAFAQGYCHPAGGFYGKLINYPDPRGAIEIFGRSYSNTNKRMAGGALELIPIGEQLEINCRLDPSLKNREGMAVFAEYHVRFALSDCAGFFGHRHSLQVAMGMYPQLVPAVDEIAGLLGIPVANLGATGSLSYGKIELEQEHGDLDLTLHGSVDELNRVFERITSWLADPAHRVIEFGKFWPMRFFCNDVLVCPFFIYDRPEEIPLADCAMDVVRDAVAFRGRISDNRHGIFLPLVLGLEQVTLDGQRAAETPLIIYDSSVRGEFRRGEALEGRGRLVRVKTARGEFQGLLLTDAAQLRRGQ